MYNHVQVSIHATLALSLMQLKTCFCFIIDLLPFAGLMPFNAG